MNYGRVRGKTANYAPDSTEKAGLIIFVIFKLLHFFVERITKSYNFK